MSGPQIFVISVGLLIAMSVSYLVLGAAADARTADSIRRRQRAVDAFATILFAEETASLETLPVARGVERDALVEVVASLPVEMGAEGRERLRAILETPRTSRMFNHLAGSKRWRRRADAARLCGLMGTPALRSRFLSDPHWVVRMTALDSLSPAQVGSHADEVAGMLLDPELVVRRAAADVLASGGVDVVLPLITILQQTGLERTAALLAASRISDRHLIGALLRCSRSDHDEVRALATAALSRQSPPEVEHMLLERLADPSHAVRAAAATGLGTIGSPRSLSALRRCLGDESWRVRRAAERSLRQCGPAGSMLVRQHEATRSELPQANPSLRAVPLPVGANLRKRP